MARHFPKQGESSDSSDEALLSAGWGLRRAPTPPQANHTFKDLPSGSFISIRIRAVGAKGARPWCDPIVARVP